MAASTTITEIKPRDDAPPRPPLPHALLNPLLATLSVDTLQVKFQVITRDDQEIIVGRLKVPTATGHAFILRRFDTGAISVSTMIRAAYPGLPDDIEKKETTWVRTAYDCAGANGQGPRRLAGVWAPLPVAMALAPSYELDEVVQPLVEAEPDPKGIARKTATRSSTATESSPLPPISSPPSKLSPASTAAASSPPAKRRRGESPSITNTPASLPKLSQTSQLPVRTTRSSASPARLTGRSSASPARSIRSRAAAVATSPKTAPVLENAAAEQAEEEAHVPGPDMNEDIAEQKLLVATLKAAQEVAASDPAAHISSVSVKRNHEETSSGDATTTTQLTLNLQKDEASVGQGADERPIATNRRILLTPARKTALWGTLAFSIGLSAAAFLPQFL
ncbi:uncharacterized protein EI90DRAFT_3285963 [Cantharellus anzutake]|uniref:uncharacterized protein n=1 Tax=Cantharellus anzutake TaxID=1750568 RepID=UPI0019043B6A|nr:uncharacterized protein EI90DRAFT_3285963 [Cantharellus anzutake]KAF8340648.1 hypothetical protein EI90DRAFT_3285963 [Cantharellus anzutake]